MALFQLNPLSCPLEERQIQALQAALIDLSAVQVAWVSGYLARIAGIGEPPAPAPELAWALTILYGSQTGNARAVAEAVGARALAQGLEAQVLSMSDYHPRKLSGERLAFLIVSTHGEGEPPESAQTLHAFLHSKRAPRLEQLHYAVLGLGDSSYEHFCQAAKDFDARLAELGAKRLLPGRYCDVDYRSDAQLWTDGALEKVAERISKNEAQIVPLPGREASAVPYHGKDNPFTASLVESRRITAEDAVADVRHLVLAADARVLRWRPGDALGVWFRNDPALADALLEATGLDGESPVTVNDASLSLRQALIERLELTQLHPSVVCAWAELGAELAPELKALAADGSRLRSYASQRQLIDLVHEHPARLDAARLAGLLLPLQPRLYSIASSPVEFEDELHLTVSVLHYHTHGGARLGGASGFLAERLWEDDALDIYVAENPGFRLPADDGAPVIMVGAGTGVAPYRGFLQERRARGDKGRHWLIFGNRHFHRDFLYQLDWQGYRREGLLDRVSLTFSRDRADKVYVQDRLREQGAEVYRWLAEGAHLYVCGSVAMGQQVHRAVVDLVAREGSLEEAAALEYVEGLREQGRYHRDLY